MSACAHPLRRLATAIVLSAVSLAGASGTVGTNQKAGGDAVAERYYPEVRLRKLHLVRPDLIPYPISFEVYC